MLRRFLSYMLILLVALQPVATFADAHQLYQPGGEHLALDHDHSGPVDHGSTHEAGQADCQHCCHCHGVTHLLHPGSSGLIIVYLPGLTLDEPCTHWPSYQASPDNPPPIS